MITTNHPPPTNDVIFQDMCIDLYKAERPDEIIEAYGRNGQVQYGIDAIVRSQARDGHFCLQCKCREKVTEALLAEDLIKTKNFDFKIWRFVFLVTTKRDRKLQDAIYRLQEQYNFQIEIRFWEEIAGAIAGHESLAKKYFEYTITKIIEVEKSPSAVHLSLTIKYSTYRFIITRMSAFEQYYGQDDLILLTGLQGEKKAGFMRMGQGHWTDIFKSAIPFEVDAYAVWKWLSQFKNFDELLDFSGEQAIEGLTPKELAELRYE